MIYILKTCIFCGKAIPTHRLEALPGTRRCYKCALDEGPDVENIPFQVGMDPETFRDLLRAIRS